MAMTSTNKSNFLSMLMWQASIKGTLYLSLILGIFLQIFNMWSKHVIQSPNVK